MITKVYFSFYTFVFHNIQLGMVGWHAMIVSNDKKYNLLKFDEGMMIYTVSLKLWGS